MGKLLVKAAALVSFAIISSYGQSGGRLLDSVNLDYLGAFNVPHVSGSENGFTWVGNGIAYNSGKKSLFIAGHTYYQKIGEISIPDPVVESDPKNLPTSTLIQSVADITEGHMDELGEGGSTISSSNYNLKIGGLLVYDNSLLGTVYPYYVDAWDAVRSHFKSSLTLDAAGDYEGMYKVGTLPSGTVNGYMATIPVDWQDDFGATCLTGNACLAIIGRSSMGPSVSTFNPEDLTLNSENSAKALVYYTEEHATLGQYTNEDYANPLYCMSSRIYGVVFPKGTKTILFIGRTGLGIPEYGAGTDDMSLDGQAVPGYPDEYYVYDPAAPSKKGAHAWPYRAYVWAYSADDLLKVYKGNLEPWDVVPYRHWIIDLPFVKDESEFLLGGAAYDEENQRIFISEKRVNGDAPVIHVLGINDKKNDLAIVDKKGALKGIGSVSYNKGLFTISTSNIPTGNYSASITLLNGKVINLGNYFMSPNKVYNIPLKDKIADGIFIFKVGNSNDVFTTRNITF